MQAKTLQAPSWLVRLLTPLIARLVARQMAAKYPELGAAEIGAKMRAEMPSGSEGRAFGMIDEVVARLPERGEASPERINAASSASVWFLVAANLLPLYGVLVWNWEVFPLLALFWMENVIIGVLNVARMLLVDPADAALWIAKLFAVPFFCFHYGMFTSIHGSFVFSLFGGRNYEVNGLRLAEPVLHSPLWALCLLVAIKIAVDVQAHRKEHKVPA